MKIIFMGTPDFAVESLKILVENNKNVVAVITAPDRKAGRGLTLHQTPVKKYALENGLTVLQPTNLKSNKFIEELKSYEADLQIVVAFRMLPEVVWSMPKQGTFNLHASLLPAYRGAAPINWAIINGEKETGVTTFFIEKDIDTGNIIDQVKIPIEEKETAGTLHDKLMNLGAHLVLKTCKDISQGTATAQPQEAELAITHAPKLSPENTQIDWSWTANYINNFVNGLNPYPLSYTFLGQKLVKIYEVETIKDISEIPNLKEVIIGEETYLTNQKSALLKKTADYYISFLDIKMQGKKRLKIRDFLSGYRFL